MVILKKIKEKLSRIIRRRKTAPVLKKSPSRKITQQEKGSVSAREAIGTRETAVEQTKFSTPAMPSSFARIEELPGGYGKDVIVLQVRDPRWVHSYWEIIGPTYDRLKSQLGNTFYAAKKMLRVYDVTEVTFDGTNAHRFYDIEVFEATSWYVDLNGAGRSWCVDIGLLLPDGRFITIARSNVVRMPLEGPSWITDEEWMIPDELFARLYGMGFGFGKSSPVGKTWQEGMRQALFSGVLASPGMASMSSPAKPLPRGRKFWLVVDAELIVYGATEPDAAVTLQGKPIALRPDGTFTARFALPDGKQVIPVEATSSDGIETRTITPIVTRETKTACLVRE